MTESPGRFRIPAALLGMGEVCGGKDAAGVLRYVHVKGGPGDRQVIEATDGALLVTVETRTQRADDDFEDTLDALVGRTDAKSIIAKADGEVVAITTGFREAEDGDEDGAEYRETHVRLGDGTEVSLKGPADDYPELDGLRDREAIRPRINQTFDSTLLLRGIRVLKRQSGVDSFTVGFALDDPLGAIRIVAEDGPKTFSAILKPVSEFASRPAIRFAQLAKALVAMVDAANKDGDLGMTPLEQGQFVKDLTYWANKATSKAAGDDSDPDPQQVLFDEVGEVIREHEEAMAEAAAREAEEKASKTPDMLPADDPNVVDSNNRQVVRPDEVEGDDDGKEEDPE